MWHMTTRMTTRDVTPAARVRPEVRQLAVDLVHGGFTGFDDAVEAIVEAFYEGEDGEPDPSGGGVTYEQAAEVVTAVWSARLTEQADWPESTDADRVLAAFGVLAEQGILAEPHFACCRSCGLSEIGADATEETQGFVFFHQQDTASAVNGAGLMLAYGGFHGSEEETTEVGHRVADALTAVGLPYEWNGSPARRIHVTPLDWQVRLSAL
jgi:hypothetical protein